MTDWQLIILHYHLQPGGVTSVIKGHVAALKTLPHDSRPQKIGIIFDGHGDPWRGSSAADASDAGVELIPIPSIGYDHGRVRDESRLVGDLVAALGRRSYDADTTILHVHNHALGKNAALPLALRHLAANGYRQLLQFHDFAEDLRPANYLHLAKHYGSIESVASNVYYAAPHVHFAVLNRRDAQIWTQAGLPPDRLHYLPNPVVRPQQNADRAAARRRVQRHWKIGDDQPFVLYPVRGIRRKNVGELLLWSTAYRGQAFFAMTLPPKNPVEQDVYRRWVRLASGTGLPVDLAAATREGIEYGDLLAAADWEITTSVAEGFGLVFLESWLVGKPLLGRDLPEITADFREAGIEFSSLQPTTQIPWEWLDRDRVAAALEYHFDRLRAAYSLPPIDRAVLQRGLEELLSGEGIDFAHLDIDLQSDLLTRVSRQPAADWSSFWRLNPKWRVLAGNEQPSAQLITENSQRIERCFGLHACGQRLYDVYARLLEAGTDLPIESLAKPESVLDAFLQLSRLHPIRLA